jgi:hypothetical protein
MKSRGTCCQVAAGHHCQVLQNNAQDLAGQIWLQEEVGSFCVVEISHKIQKILPLWWNSTTSALRIQMKAWMLWSNQVGSTWSRKRSEWRSDKKEYRG